MIYLLIALLIPPLIEDIRERQIRNLYPFLIVVAKVIVLVLSKNKDAAIKSVIASLIAFAIFGFCFLVSKEGIGVGDIKLLISIAFYLETELFLRGLLYICLCSILFSLILLATKKAKLKSQFPFVPFVFAGILVATLTEALF